MGQYHNFNFDTISIQNIAILIRYVYLTTRNINFWWLNQLTQCNVCTVSLQFLVCHSTNTDTSLYIWRRYQNYCGNKINDEAAVI